MEFFNSQNDNHHDNMSVQCIPPYTPLLYSKTGVYRGIRGVFQKYAERLHRMFAIAAMLMIFHVGNAWYIFIK